MIVTALLSNCYCAVRSYHADSLFGNPQIPVVPVGDERHVTKLLDYRPDHTGSPSLMPLHNMSFLTHLPYERELGATLRDRAVPDSRPVWLRLGGGQQELFAQWPERTLKQHGRRVQLLDAKGPTTEAEGPDALWALLRTAHTPEAPLSASPYQGGWIGFVGYDQGRESPATGNVPVFPTALLGDYRRFVFIDHQRETAELVTLSGYSGPLDDPKVIIRECQVGHTPRPFELLQDFVALTPKARYLDDVARIKDYLQAGDCYQVNYAQAFRARCAGSGAEAMQRLLRLTQAPHAAWMLAPEGEILSLSPELFLSIRDGVVCTKPIKGTAPRGDSKEQDQRLREELAASPKNRAENLMIVDLLRHDLGRHADTGSVKVDKLFDIESLPQVHHMVSTVSARLSDSADTVNMIRDCFPGGSITGAPKKRAMEIIAELEPTPRSVYCGSIGFIGANGDAELNIAIRTLLRIDDELYAWAGGGIVADSNAEAEYQECFDKMGALMRALENPA